MYIYYIFTLSSNAEIMVLKKKQEELEMLDGHKNVLNFF
jgi:hypothetical protein